MPVTSFSEYKTLPDGRKSPIWFALNQDRPLAILAGIWTRWTSVRKAREGKVTADRFAFLTTEPGEAVRTHHQTAMPVALTEADELETWMTAPPAMALGLNRPLPNGRLVVVTRGEKGDPG